jgi:hypothetical protein
VRLHFALYQHRAPQPHIGRQGSLLLPQLQHSTEIGKFGIMETLIYSEFQRRMDAPPFLIALSD